MLEKKYRQNFFYLITLYIIRSRISIIMNTSRRSTHEILVSSNLRLSPPLPIPIPILASSFPFLFPLQKSVAKLLFIQRLTSCILFYPAYRHRNIMEEKVMVHKLQGEWWNIEAPFKHTDKRRGQIAYKCNCTMTVNAVGLCFYSSRSFFLPPPLPSSLLLPLYDDTVHRFEVDRIYYRASRFEVYAYMTGGGQYATLIFGIYYRDKYLCTLGWRIRGWKDGNTLNSCLLIARRWGISQLEYLFDVN